MRSKSIWSLFLFPENRKFSYKILDGESDVPDLHLKQGY
jgi:hypothetical protein